MLLLEKLKRAVLLGLVATMVGCASIPAGVQPSPHDPWEPFNRSVFEFNEGCSVTPFIAHKLVCKG
jgi:phospholipid-binding lipoprotein MlaA